MHDPKAALRYARRAVELEDDPRFWGYVVARQALGGTLLGQAWSVRPARAPGGLDTPARRALPALLLLQAAAHSPWPCSIPASPMGPAPRSARSRPRPPPSRRRGATAPPRRSPWSGSREGRLTAIDGAMAAVWRCCSARSSSPRMGPLSLVIGALTNLAAAQWATGDRPAARSSLARAREVAESERPPTQHVAQLVALEARIGRRAAAAAMDRGALVEDLTDRELAMLRALPGPLSAREIGAELYLSINTVKGYTKSLYRKLGVVTRADAVRRARHLGLI